MKAINRWHIVKDGAIVGAASTRQQAIEMIRVMQERETWYIKAQFSIIYGAEEFINYKKGA